jgi:hypothetical protein
MIGYEYDKPYYERYNINENRGKMFSMINTNRLQEIPTSESKLLILVDLYSFTAIGRFKIIMKIKEFTKTDWFRRNMMGNALPRLPDIPEPLKNAYALYMLFFAPLEYDRNGYPKYGMYDNYAMEQLFPTQTVNVTKEKKKSFLTLPIFVKMIEELKKLGHVVVVDQLFPFKNRSELYRKHKTDRRDPLSLISHNQFKYKFYHYFKKLRYDTVFTEYRMSREQKNNIFQDFNICCLGGYDNFINNYYDFEMSVLKYTRFREVYKVGDLVIYETRDKSTNEVNPGYFIIYGNSYFPLQLKDIQFCKIILKLLFGHIQNRGVNNLVLGNNISATRPNRSIAGPSRIVEEPVQEVVGGSKRSVKKRTTAAKKTKTTAAKKTRTTAAKKTRTAAAKKTRK